jgi:hypothetical protein
MMARQPSIGAGALTADDLHDFDAWLAERVIAAPASNPSTSSMLSPLTTIVQ